MDILRMLYEARPCTPIDNEDYHKVLQNTCKAEQELLQAYPEIREMLNIYQSAQLSLFSHTSYQEFVMGFQMGAQMMLEIFEPLKKSL